MNFGTAKDLNSHTEIAGPSKIEGTAAKLAHFEWQHFHLLYMLHLLHIGLVCPFVNRPTHVGSTAMFN